MTPPHTAFTQLAQAWNSLSGTEKSTWETLGQQNTNPVQNGVPPRAGGYSSFVGHNASLFAGGLSIMTSAPAQIDAPPLPPIETDADFGPPLSLMLTPDTAYPYRVLIYGAKPMLAPRAVYENTPFLLLGSLPTLGDGADVAALYSVRFRMLTAGYKVALHIVGVSDTGFRTAPLLVTGFRTAPLLVTGIVVPRDGGPIPSARLNATSTLNRANGSSKRFRASAK